MTEVISPFGADNLPLRELKKQTQPKTGFPAYKKNKLLITALAIIIFFLLIVILLLLLKKPQVLPSLPPSPSPVLVSPSPVATESALPKSLPERLESLEKQLKEVDLSQTRLSFPILDFNVNFEQKR